MNTTNHVASEEISCKKHWSNIVKKGLKQSVFLLGEMTWFKSDNFLLIYILKAFVGNIHSHIEYWDRYRVIYRDNYIHSFRQSAITTISSSTELIFL